MFVKPTRFTNMTTLLSSADCLKKYGPPELEKSMVLWDVPKELEIGVIPKRIYCNKDMVKPLTLAFQNLIKTGFVKELKTWDGCVSGDTEYFTGNGWREIESYDGGLVGQVDELGSLSMVKPSKFIDLPCDRFIKIQSEQGVSQVVSGDHRVIYLDYLNRENIILADEAEFTYENFKAEGLTVNSIEAEGYLRCAKTILNIIALVEGE